MPDTLRYILVIAGVTFLVRALPFLLIRRPVRSPRVRAFLDYVPYVTLAAMAFPDMVLATGNWYSGLAAFAAAGIVAWRKGGLIPVTAAACLAVLALELLPVCRKICDLPAKALPFHHAA